MNRVMVRCCCTPHLPSAISARLNCLDTASLPTPKDVCARGGRGLKNSCPLPYRQPRNPSLTVHALMPDQGFGSGTEEKQRCDVAHRKRSKPGLRLPVGADALRALIVGNWKMHTVGLELEQIAALAASLQAAPLRADVRICRRGTRSHGRHRRSQRRDAERSRYERGRTDLDRIAFETMTRSNFHDREQTR